MEFLLSGWLEVGQDSFSQAVRVEPVATGEDVERFGQEKVRAENTPVAGPEYGGVNIVFSPGDSRFLGQDFGVLEVYDYKWFISNGNGKNKSHHERRKFNVLQLYHN